MVSVYFILQEETTLLKATFWLSVARDLLYDLREQDTMSKSKHLVDKTPLISNVAMLGYLCQTYATFANNNRTRTRDVIRKLPRATRLYLPKGCKKTSSRRCRDNLMWAFRKSLETLVDNTDTISTTTTTTIPEPTTTTRRNRGRKNKGKGKQNERKQRRKNKSTKKERQRENKESVGNDDVNEWM